MNKKLYVGGLSYTVTDSQLQALFASHGTVESAKVVMDRDTDRSRGFGFVEMSTPSEAERATNELNGHELQGRRLTVSEARERTGGGGGGGGGRGGFGGGGGGGGGRGGFGGGGGGGGGGRRRY